MKKTKIYLQCPWGFPDSPYYKYLIKELPKEIEYLNIQKQKGAIASASKFLFLNKLKNTLREVLHIIKMPNITKTKKGPYDLIHCGHCLSLNRKPWIVDLEHYWNFASSGKLAYSKKGKKRIKQLLKKPYCKKILPWTEAAKKTVVNTLKDKKIDKKIQVLHPAIPFPNCKRKKRSKITLLFVGRYFYWKGGLHALEAIDQLTKKHKNVEAVFISEVPRNILNKYSKNKKIKIYGLMPQEEVFKIYSESDIFIYPGYSDTFGFAMLEAMGFGLPVISVDGFARKEIIDEGKTGFVVQNQGKINNEIIGEQEKEIIKELVKKTSLLIKNKRLLNKMSKNCIEAVKNGKFSIKERNKKLKKIYFNAIEDD